MKKVEIYTDGACSGNPGPGGWGALLRYRSGDKVYEKELSGGDSSTTNNRMELTAFIEAVGLLKEPCEIRFCSDSQYVINGLEKGWARSWRARGWKKADKSPAQNPDLWARALELAEKTHHHLRLGQGPCGPPGERALRPSGRGAEQSTWREAELNMNDTILPGSGFDTYEEQDKVLVGMSGGVDSSVAVRILQQQGFAVTGAVIRFSDAHDGAVQAARQAAQQLGIECIVLDAQALFEQEVVAPFCADYCAGRTPNPCVRCNPAVKFTALLAAADRLGIQYIATGHYARVEVDADGVSRIHLPQSAARDQTYMLSRLDQEVLSRLVLPWANLKRTTCARWPGTSAWTAPTPPTAWRSASSPAGTMPPSSGTAAWRARPDGSSPPTERTLAPTKGCCTTRWASARAWALPWASRCSSVRSAPTAISVWPGPGRNFSPP